MNVTISWIMTYNVYSLFQVRPKHYISEGQCKHVSKRSYFIKTLYLYLLRNIRLIILSWQAYNYQAYSSVVALYVKPSLIRLQLISIEIWNWKKKKLFPEEYML
jgi:hypothetical protein